MRDIRTRQILGAENDVKFSEHSCQVQRVSIEKFVTLVQDGDKDICMIELFASSRGSYFETRRIKNYCNCSDEQ